MNELTPEQLEMQQELSDAILSGDVLMSMQTVTNENGEEEYNNVEFSGQTEKGIELVQKLKKFLKIK